MVLSHPQTVDVEPHLGILAGISDVRRFQGLLHCDPFSCPTQLEQRRQGMVEFARRFWDDESGQGLAEYALLLGLIVIGVVVLIQGMGKSITKIFTKANSDLKTAADAAT
jgi:pilus assembly protein Flp/PilA